MLLLLHNPKCRALFQADSTVHIETNRNKKGKHIVKIDEAPKEK
jgi:hypothetical protein